MKKTAQAGFTLIEILIATVVVAMVLTAVASMLTVSVKNTAQSRYQEVARARAQTGLEFFRRERNTLGWESFRAVLNSATYCINTIPANSSAFATMPTGSCSTGVVVIGTEFQRSAEVLIVSPDEVRVDVSVTWIDGALDKEVQLTQIFRKYESE